MGNLNKKTLSLLSLLSIVGILSMPLFMKTDFIIIPMMMCLIGGVSFGMLLRNKIN